MTQQSLFEARRTDPVTSHEAARRVRPAHAALTATIRMVATVPMTQFGIAAAVEELFPGRWKEATIRTACARADLKCVGRVTVDGQGFTTWIAS